MAKYSNTIEYNIITKLNSSGISQLQTQLKQLELSMQKFSNQKLLSEKSVSEARTQLQGLSSALTKSFNPSLGMLDLTKFNTQLKESGVSAQGLTKAFNLGGAQGQVALNNLTAQIGKFNTGIERSSSTVDKMFNTIQNTFRWGLVSSAFSQFMNMIHQSVNYVKDLDSSLTQIMLVTDYSRAQMQEYAKSANEAAKALGNTTTGMTNASLVFAQQGYNIQDSQRLAESSVKLANASQQDTATTSDQITAYMNAYGLDMHTGELNKALDSWAEVANVSAADVAELAGASQKAASSAKAMGVSTDQLNAQIATIESVTRGAPEEIGNGLKTLYARFSDIKMGETVEGDVDLGKVTGTLDKIGVQVLDKMGNMRNVGDIMEDLMGVWQTLDDNAKKSAATTLAGKHQVDRFLALMNNSDMYEQYKSSSEDATGTLDKMNEEYVNSIEGKTKQFQATVEGLLSELLNPDAIYPLIDTFKGFLEVVKELVKSLGGGQTILAGVTALFTRMFSKNISQTINDAKSNMQIGEIRKANMLSKETALRLTGAENSPVAEYVKYGVQNASRLTDKEFDNLGELIGMKTTSSNNLAMAKEALEEHVLATNLLGGSLLGAKDFIFKDKENGEYNNAFQLDILKSLGAFGGGKGINKDFVKSLNDDDFKDLGFALEEYGTKLQEVKKYQDALEAPGANEKTREENLKSLKKAVQELEEAYSLLNETVANGAAEGTHFEDIVNKVKTEINNNNKKGLTEETKSNIDKVGTMIGHLGEQMQSGKIVKEDVANTTKLERRKSDYSTTQVMDDAVDETFKGAQDSTRARLQTEQFIRLTSAISELSFAWQGFQSIGSIWSNKDMEPGEKLLRIITDLGFAIPTLINGLTTMKNSVKNIDWENVFNDRQNTISDLENLKNRDMEALDKKRTAIALNNEDYVALQGEWELADQQEKQAKQGLENKKNSDKVNRGFQTKLTNAQNDKKVLENEMGDILNQIEGFQDLDEQMKKTGQAYDSIIAKNKSLGKVASAANAVMGALGEGLSGLMNIMTNPAVGFGIAIATAIVSAIQTGLEEARKEANEQFDKAKSEYEQIQPQVDEFDKLYETWKTTGKGAEELKDKGLELSKSLNILGGDALAASGNFDALKRSIDEVDDKKLNDLITKASGAMSQNENYGFLNTSSLKTLGNKSLFNESPNPFASANDIGYTDRGDAVDSSLQIANVEIANQDNIPTTSEITTKQKIAKRVKESETTDGESVAAQMGRLKATIDITRQELEAMSEDDSERESLITALRDLEADYGGEEASKWREAAETRIKARAQQTSFINKLNEKGQDTGQIWDLFKNDIDTKDYFESLGPASAQNQFIAENMSDPTLKTRFSLNAYKEKAKEQDKYINENMLQGFDEDTQLKIVASLDLTKSQEAINEDLKELQENYKGLDENGKIKISAENYRSDADIEKMKDELKLSDEQYDRYVRNLTAENENLQQMQNNIDSLKKQKEAMEGNGEAVEKLQAQIDQYTAALKDCQSRVVETAMGAKELSQVWEESSAVLSDETSSFNEVGDAIEKIIPGLGHLLNMDASSLRAMGEDFFTNKDNLADIQDAINGDVDALQRLRGEAEKRILLQIGIDENNSLYTDMLSIINTANQILPELVVGARLEDEAFNQQLTQWVLNAIAAGKTIEEITDQLANLGIEAYVAGEDGIDIPLPKLVQKAVYTTKHDPGAPKEYQQMTTTEMETEFTKAWMPNIKYRKTSGGANFNGGASYTPHSSGGSGGGGRGGGGSGGGGGGGGGSEKTYTPKHKDPIEEEVDLYEKVNTKLNDVQEALKNIQQETDRLIGPSGQANMRKQLTLLQKEIDLQNEKLDIQQKERDDLRNQLNPFGVTFDSEGFISNYADVLKSLEGRVNDLTNQYNADTTEEGQNRLEDEIEGAKKNLDKFKDLYKRYDELQGQEIQETINQIEELKDSIEDLSIEAYKASQQALDDIKDIRDGWAELQGFFSGFKTDSPFRGIIEDVDKLETILGRNKKSVSDYYDTLISRNEQLADSYNKAGKAAEAEAAADYANYFRREKTKALSRSAGEGGSTLLGLATADMEQLLRWQQSGTTDSPFGENQAALAEALEDAYNRVKDMLLDAEKEWEQLEEDIIDGFDKIAEKEEEHIDNFDRITNRLEHVADMIALTSGEEAYGEMAATYGQMAQTSLAEAQAQKEIVSWWEQRLSTIQDKNSDIYKAVKQHLEDAQDKLMELQKESAENFQKEYENAVQKILANMNKKILGVSNIDRVTDDWERDKDYASRYYDDVQKANHVEQLRIKYLNLLDDAQNASLDIQRKIRDSMGEQVGYLQDQAHLSEFNVRYANAQLEILQKQLALEDARNNKNQMRLRRDTQGNYKYVYAANQDDIRQREADLLQSEMDAYDMSTQNRMDVYSQWIAAYQQYQQRYAELQRLAASQNEQVAQEARDALVKLEADFARDMKAYSEELNDSWEGMMGALSWMAETGTDTIRDSAEIAMDAIREKTDESLGAVGIQWNETIDGAIEDISGLLKVATDAWAEIGSVTVKYSNTIKTEVDSLIQDGFGNLSDCLKNAASETGELTRETAKLKDVLNADSTALQNAQKELEKYRDSLDQVRSKSSVVASTLYSTRNELETTKSQNRAQQEELDAWRSGQKTLQNQNGGNGGGGGGGGRGGFHVGDIVGFNDWYYYDSWGTDPAGNWYSGEPNAVRISDFSGASVGGYQDTGDFSVHLETLGGGWLGWVRPEQLFDTGGYTGEWGTEGRVAMLHQKELVLNAQDTENVLQAVNLVRQMTDALKGSFNIGSMVQKGTQVNKLGQDTIEQRVEITAEFPNVHNSDDIRNALLDLSNSAFQYSYKEV